MLPYRQRNAGAVIHTHSPKAVMATLLWPGKEFRCTHLEMIKVRSHLHRFWLAIYLVIFSISNQGIYNHTLGRYLRYDEELIVPIIENTPFEKDLEDRMNETMQKYPGSTAILVRRHGVYVWGETWQKAKAQWVHIYRQDIVDIQLTLHTQFAIFLNYFFTSPTRTECYDYLFGIAIEMKKCGLDPTETPANTE